MVICYEASDEVRNERLTRRDGSPMTEEQKNHRSEQQIDLIKQKASAIINTDNITIDQQTKMTMDLIQSFTDVYA